MEIEKTVAVIIRHAADLKASDLFILSEENAVRIAARRLVAASRPASEIQPATVKTGMTEFHRSALLKVAQGVTSTEEILRDVPAKDLGLED